MGILSNIHLCSTVSYAFLMSMLSITRFCWVPLVFLCTNCNACFALRPMRKPKLRGSALCSWCTSRMKFHNVCAARSFIVGMPNGRVSLELFLGIYTRLMGSHLYWFQFRFFSHKIPSHFCSSRFHNCPSIPAVLLPLFVVTLRIDSALHANDINTSLWICLITSFFCSNFSALYNLACNRNSSILQAIQLICFQGCRPIFLFKFFAICVLYVLIVT